MTHQTGSKNGDTDRADAEIGRLLEDAGRRPDVPLDEFMAIKANARAEWLRRVDQRRSRTKWRSLMSPLPAAAAIIIAIALAWWWRQETTSPIPEAFASIEFLSGDVWIEEADGADAIQPAGSGLLAAGAEIVTGDESPGPPSLIAVRLAGGQSVRLPTASRAKLISSSQIELLRGAVYVDSGDAPQGAPIEIVTAFGSVTDIGTQFEVRLGDAESDLRVRVRSGKVSLARDGGEHTAERGEELSVDADGPVERSTYEPAGSEWDWILTAAPPLEIEGLPLSEFLGWVSAETGLAVEFEDRALGDAVGTIELHGTIEGLRPDEALLAVIPGTGLDYRIEGGSLQIVRRQ